MCPRNDANAGISAPGPAGALSACLGARCKIVRRTRSLIFMSADLVVGERVVATGNGVWKTLGAS
jgi:acyl-coenzyme A thioesterase PaaI-like protein